MDNIVNTICNKVERKHNQTQKNPNNKSKKFVQIIKYVPYLMILPTIIGLAIFNFYPLFLSIIKSTYNWSGTLSPEYGGANEFIWLNNYITLFKDQIYWQTWLNVLFFLVTGVIINFIFPYLNALLIFSLKGDKSKFLYRTLFVLPMVVPTIVIFLLWEFIYEPNIGLISNIFKVLNINEGFVNILGEVKSVKWGIRFMGFPWVGGTALLIYLAGLSSIDNSLREAARIDGANTIMRLLKIDIPLCAGQFKMIFVLTVIGEIQDFVKIQTITSGGPGYSSSVPALYMYNTAFSSSKYGLACAAGMIMLVVMLLLSYLSNKFFKVDKEN